MRKRDINLRKKNNKQTKPEVRPWNNGWKEHAAEIEADKAAKEAALKKEAKDQARRKLNGWIDASLLAHSKIYFDCECGWPNLMISERMPCGSCRWCCTCESHEGTEEVMCLCGTHIQHNNVEIWNQMEYNKEDAQNVRYTLHDELYDPDGPPYWRDHELSSRIEEIEEAIFGDNHMRKPYFERTESNLNVHISKCQVIKESITLLIANGYELRPGWDKDENLLDIDLNITVSKDAPNMVRMRVVRMKLRMMSDSQRREFYALYSAEVARLFKEWLDSQVQLGNCVNIEYHDEGERKLRTYRRWEPWGGVYIPRRYYSVWGGLEHKIDLEKEVRKQMWDVYRFDDAVMQWMQATVMRITDGENS
jgi:hypothetical protein